jgi:hypothetical protein
MTENRLHMGNLGPGDVALLKDVAEAAADHAVKKWLTMIGIDTNNPIEAQEDFKLLRDMSAWSKDEERMKDRAWTRRMRGHSEGIVGKVILTAVGLAVVGALNAVWAGVKTFIR